MATTKLPVFQALEDSFSVTSSNFLSILKVMLLPAIAITAAQYYFFMPRFAELLPSLEKLQTGDTSGIGPEFWTAYATTMGIMFVLVILFLAIIAVPIVRLGALDEKPGLLRLDGVVFKYLAMLIVFPIILIIALAPGVGLMVGADYLVNEGALPDYALTIAFILMFIYFFFMEYRLILVPVDVAVSGQFRISGGWQASRGNVLRLFGAHFLFVIILIVVLIIAVIISVLASVLVGLLDPTMPTFMQQLNDPGAMLTWQMENFLKVPHLILMAVSFLINGAFFGLAMIFSGIIYKHVSANIKN